MKCVYCNQNFYVKKSILKLFNTEKEYICNSCYKKYPISLKIENIMLDKYNCKVISIFKKKHYINLNYYIKEYSKIFEAFYKKEDYELLFFDEISFDDFNLMILDGISKLVSKDIVVIVFYIKL